LGDVLLCFHLFDLSAQHSHGLFACFDYIRRGTTTLFAALNILDGTVIRRNMQHHRHQEFIRFLNTIEEHVPGGK
jgi:hypothetical protein